MDLDCASDATVNDDNALTPERRSPYGSDRKRRRQTTNDSSEDEHRPNKLKSMVVWSGGQRDSQFKSIEPVYMKFPRTTMEKKISQQISIDGFIEMMQRSIPGQKPSKRVRSFDELNISSNLLKGLNRMYIERMTEFQSVLLPKLLNNKNEHVFVRSKPQSLKKTCYLISSIQAIESDSSKLQSIILVPTADVAVYLFEIARKMARYRNIHIGYATKDHGWRKDDFKNLLIATPGTLLQCIEEYSTFSLRSVRTLVIDEFELHLSSKNNVRKLIKVIDYLRVSENLKFKIFSTCFGEYSQFFIKKNISRKIVEIDLLRPDCFKEFNQFYVPCNQRDDKYRSLVKLLRRSVLPKVVIYISRISPAQKLCRELCRDGFRNVMVLTSTSSVDERLNVNNSFNSVKQGILVLNYPLLLGISLDDLSLVVNYHLPGGESRYIFHEFHKISKSLGGNGRAGFIINLVDEYEQKSVYKLEKFFKFRMHRLSVGSLDWKVINSTDSL